MRGGIDRKQGNDERKYPLKITTKKLEDVMTTTHTLKSVLDLDLDPIKVKLMHKQSGEGWDLAKANAVEVEYKRFLHLSKEYPNELIAPTEDVDTFWHYHILDTMKYAADCDAAFGYFLHHFPYVGLRGDDEAEQVRSAERMRELYESVFGTPYLASAAYCTRAQQADAGAAYCTRAAPRDAAYCTRALQAAASYCTRAPQAASAYCTRAQQASYCTRSAAPSYCTRAQVTESHNAARPELAAA
jgi:hypothetical protein